MRGEAALRPWSSQDAGNYTHTSTPPPRRRQRAPASLPSSAQGLEGWKGRAPPGADLPSRSQPEELVSSETRAPVSRLSTHTY